MQVLPDLGEEEVERVFSALDVDHTGTIDVKEFFAGLLHTMDAEHQAAVAYKFFTALDRWGGGACLGQFLVFVLMPATAVCQAFIDVLACV